MADTHVPRWACTVDRGMCACDRVVRWALRFIVPFIMLAAVVALNVVIVIMVAPGLLGIQDAVPVVFRVVMALVAAVLDVALVYIAADLALDGRYGYGWRQRCTKGDTSLPRWVHAVAGAMDAVDAIATRVFVGLFSTVVAIFVVVVAAVVNCAALMVIAPELPVALGWAAPLQDLPPLWMRVSMGVLIVICDAFIVYVSAEIGFSEWFGMNWREICQERRERRKA